MYRETQEHLNNYKFLSASHNLFKCASLHTLMVKIGGGLTFFGQYTNLQMFDSFFKITVNVLI